MRALALMCSASLWSGMRRQRRTTTRLSMFVVASLLASCYGSAFVLADTPSLSVVNLGQPSATVIAGQPALTLASSGTCEVPFTLESESACLPGSWPTLGEAWGPTEDVAGGDQLRLTFSSAVSNVTIPPVNQSLTMMFSRRPPQCPPLRPSGT